MYRFIDYETRTTITSSSLIFAKGQRISLQDSCVTAMIFDWTGTHYLENKIHSRGRMGPKSRSSSERTAEEAPQSPWTPAGKEMWPSAAYPPEPAPLAQLEGVLHTGDPGRTHWKNKLQLRRRAACEPKRPPVLMARDLAKLSDVPTLRRDM